MRKRGEDEKKEEEEEEEEGRPDGRCLSLSVTVRSSVETSKDVGPLFCFVLFFSFSDAQLEAPRAAAESSRAHKSPHFRLCSWDLSSLFSPARQKDKDANSEI